MKLLRLVLVLALLAALPAAAQNAITLYGGWRGGGAFDQSTAAGGTTTATDLASSGTLAFSVERALDPARNWQVFASTQRTTMPLVPAGSGGVTELALNVTYLHFGGSNFLEGRAGQGGYVAGGLGATWMSPRESGWQSELRPSLSVALGWEHALSPTIALRAEVRGYATLVHSGGGFFCSGGCTVVIRGDSFVQVDALIGLSARF